MTINKQIDKGYMGEFKIELYPNIPIDFLKNAKIDFFQDGNIIHIFNGRVKQSMGGIQMYSYEKPFYFKYSDMKKITADNGDILWQNKYDTKK